MLILNAGPELKDLGILNKLVKTGGLPRRLFTVSNISDGSTISKTLGEVLKLSSAKTIC